MRCPIILLLVIVPTAALALSTTSSSRDVLSLSQWAKQQGIVMHENLQWKQYNDPDHEDSNWGLELKEPVPAGTTLLQVPHDLVLDSDSIYDEFKLNDGEKLLQALERLGDFDIHAEVFLIVIKLLRCSKQGDVDSRWSPWIQALPKTFPAGEFTSDEQACLPYYTKVAVEYQNKKFQAFCQAAAELDEWKNDGDDDPLLDTDAAKLKWAFHAVSSRCWKTAPRNNSEKDDAPKANTELVPIGDMFNHREPANVDLTHEGDTVNFVYKGDTTNDNDNDNDNNKDLYLTYGSPSNPHRFLAIFGFVPDPEDMPEVWSHLVFPNDNPFSEDASKMVFRTADGAIAEPVWDAVLYGLLQSQGMSFNSNLYTKEEMHAKYKFATSRILRNHVTRLLEELAVLRQKIEATSDDGENLDLIRQHNEFLTTVFSRVQAHLNDDDDEQS